MTSGIVTTQHLLFSYSSKHEKDQHFDCRKIRLLLHVNRNLYSLLTKSIKISMRTITRHRNYHAPIEKVFGRLDDLGVTGMHMTESSAMMMGSKLRLTYLSDNRTGLNAKYRWQGSMMGMPMDFTVLVTKWIRDKEKIWETVGKTDLIIYSWYRMSLTVSKTPIGSKAELSICYERPTGFFKKVVSFLFADLYCIWCLNSMLNDAAKSI